MSTLRTAVGLLLAGPLLAGAAPARAEALPRHHPVPGGVAVVAIGPAPAPPTARFGGREVLVVRARGAWVAVVGIPLDARPGPVRLDVSGRDGQRTVTFRIRPHRYPEQRITLRDPKMVTPPASALARIRAETARLRRGLAHRSPGRPERLRFPPPADGPLSSRFGLRRILNGKPRSPHRGLDIAAPRGAPVRAPIAGTVLDVGDFYFTGHTVLLDHGGGLVTLYCHLDRVDVRPGQRLAASERIGAVGASGRATGPHLHWAVALNGHLVDPALFLETPSPAVAAR